MVRSRKKSAPKKKKTPQLSLRQIKYKKNRLLGMNRMNAGIAAGYSREYMRTKSWRVEDVVKCSIIDELDRAGATDRVIAQKLVQLALGAQKIQHCTLYIEQADGKFKVQKNSNDFIEVPDERLQKDALELLTKLKKHVTNAPVVDQSEHTHLTIVLEKDEYEDNKARDLADRETEPRMEIAD